MYVLDVSQIWIYPYLFLSIYIFIYKYICIYMHIYIYIYIYMYIYILYIRIRRFVVFINIMNIHIQKYTRKHKNKRKYISRIYNI